MKKNIYYLLAMMMVTMLSVGFASCGGDDDEDGSPSGGGVPGSSLIVGVWQSYATEFYDDNWNPTDSDNDDDIIIQFGERTGVVYELNGSKWEAYPFAYGISGNTLTISYNGGDKGTMEIMTLTETELVVKEYDEDEWIVSKFNRVSNSVLPNVK